jgi:hypothetical protein
VATSEPNTLPYDERSRPRWRYRQEAASRNVGTTK